MTPLIEHDDVLSAPARRRFSPLVTALLWGGILSLGLLILGVATDVVGLDAKAAAQNTVSALLGVLVVVAALAVIVLAVLRRSVLLAGLGVMVLVGGVGTLATTFGLPDHMRGTLAFIDSFFALLGQLIDLLARLLDWKK